MARKESRQKRNNRKKRLDFLAILAAFGLLILPLVQDGKAMDTSLLPRLVALYGFLVIASLMLIRKSAESMYDFAVFKNPLIYLPALLLITGVSSLFFAINASAGSYDIAKTFAIIVFTAISAMVLLKTTNWDTRLTRFFIIGAAVSLAIGYYQFFTKVGLGIHERGEMYAVNGLMSNVNLYANYLLMLIPFLGYGMIRLEGIWRRIAITVFLLCMIMLVMLQTRAAYMGIIAGFFSLGLLLFILFNHFGLNKKWKTLLAVSLISLPLLFMAMYMFLPEGNLYLARFNSVFSDSENPRFVVWSICRSMMTDHPLTGVGAGNFAISVQGYYGNYVLPEDWTFNWMRPHNDFLWVGVEKGIPGFLLFISIFVTAIYYTILIIVGNGHEKDELANKWLALFLFMGLISYMVNSLFDFPLERVNHQVILAIWMAGIIALSHKKRNETGTLKPGNKRWFLLVLTGLLSIGTVYSAIVLQQERRISEAREAEAKQDWEAMLAAADRANQTFKNIDALGVPVAFFQGYGHFKLGNYEEAMHYWEISRSQNPYRKYILQNLGVLYNHFGMYDKTIEVLLLLTGIYGVDDQNVRILGEAYFYKGEMEKALQVLERIPESERSDLTLSSIRQVRDAKDELEQNE